MSGRWETGFPSLLPVLRVGTAEGGQDDSLVKCIPGVFQLVLGLCQGPSGLGLLSTQDPSRCRAGWPGLGVGLASFLLLSVKAGLDLLRAGGLSHKDQNLLPGGSLGFEDQAFFTFISHAREICRD